MQNNQYYKNKAMPSENACKSYFKLKLMKTNKQSKKQFKRNLFDKGW